MMAGFQAEQSKLATYSLLSVLEPALPSKSSTMYHFVIKKAKIISVIKTAKQKKFCTNYRYFKSAALYRVTTVFYEF